MPKILITGNGFDLHHNLPTAYKDFIKIISIVLEKNEPTFEDIYSKSDSYEKIKSTFKNELNIVPEHINEIKNIAKDNIFFNYFKEELEIDTWIDFESKIEYLLETIYKSIKLIREKISIHGPIPIGHSRSTAFLNNNIIYMSTLNRLKVISDYRITFEDEYSILKDNYLVDINEEKLLKVLYDSLIDFKKLFHLYLQNFVTPLYDKYINADYKKDFLDNIDYHFTFNYTPTFIKLYNNKTIKYLHLHGKSNNSEAENIVLGINDIFNIDCNKKYLKFTKYYQKYDYKTDFHFLDSISPIKQTNCVFYFWGHSLDKSDASYINEVFDTLDKFEGNIKEVVIIYHKESSRSEYILNLLAIRGKTDIEKRMRNNSLQFYQSDSSELKQSLNKNIEYIKDAKYKVIKKT